jgi:hypothetical protein
MSNVYAICPHTAQKPDHITEGIGIINTALLERVVQNFRERIRKSIEFYVCHVERTKHGY